MPRKAREKSSSGIYHVMHRGINRQDIFLDDEDRMKFIETLVRFKKICEYEVLGYCLMSNHVHLLIREGKETISQAMKRIGASYVYWYNMKYERSGHLFQDRFKSETVEDDKYLLTVLRYIHQNPIKAGIVDKIDKYKWSSYSEYIKEKNFMVDTEFVLSMLSPEHNKSIKIFKEFMINANEDKCLDDEINKTRKQLSDEDVKKHIIELLKSENIQILQQMKKEERDKIIRKIKGEGVSLRQLSRITGLGRGVIEKA